MFLIWATKSCLSLARMGDQFSKLTDIPVQQGLETTS